MLGNALCEQACPKTKITPGGESLGIQQSLIPLPISPSGAACLLPVTAHASEWHLVCGKSGVLCMGRTRIPVSHDLLYRI
jgi:hypothetical protein